MGEGQSKPTTPSEKLNRQRRQQRERKPIEQKEELEAKDLAALAARCVPKALQEERKPRNIGTVAAPPTAPAPPPTAPPTAGQQSPRKRGEANLVRTDSQILRATGGVAQPLIRTDSQILRASGGTAQPLVRSNSNIVVPVAKVQQQVLVRSNSSIIMSSDAVQAARAFQRTDSNVVRATVAAAQAQNMARASSLVVPKTTAQAALAGQNQMNHGSLRVAPNLAALAPKAPSLIPPVGGWQAPMGGPKSPSQVPPVGGYPMSQSYAVAMTAPPTTQCFVKAGSLTAPPLSSVTLKAPAPSTMKTASSIAAAPPPKKIDDLDKLATIAAAEVSQVPASVPASVKLMKATPTTVQATQVLKVRATKEERDALSRSALMAQQVSQGTALYPSKATSLSTSLKWTPPQEGALPKSPPVENVPPPGIQKGMALQSVQQVSVPYTNGRAATAATTATQNIFSSTFTWSGPQVANSVVGSSVRSGSLTRYSGKASEMSQLQQAQYDALQTPVMSVPFPSPRSPVKQSQSPPSPDAKASEPIGGPSLIRAMAAKYQDSTPPKAKDMDTQYQTKAQITRAMAGMEAH